MALPLQASERKKRPHYPNLIPSQMWYPQALDHSRSRYDERCSLNPGGGGARHESLLADRRLLMLDWSLPCPYRGRAARSTPSSGLGTGWGSQGPAELGAGHARQGRAYAKKPMATSARLSSVCWCNFFGEAHIWLLVVVCC